MVGGMVYALGMAAASPMLLALAIDVGNPERPGAAMATFSAAFQIGPAVGAPTAGWLIESFGYQTMYGVAIGVAVFGLGLTLLRWRVSGDTRQASKAVAPRLGINKGGPHA
jgi:predicted MFS family arabinose efflux permease